MRQRKLGAGAAEKLAHALDASLNIALDGDESRISFTPHETDAA
ncbi:hypothetical protein [Kribbella sindirgiensis]|nr:hypothetical protein [Kribbella sindirgiensis]